ncbi:MAG: UDP-2,3-diacylglucosamine diphosphatase LpxI [Candidatus Omnitrophota bacterium]
MRNEKIGLIAGNGKFPILFARAARKQGLDVIAAAVRGDTSLLLRPFVDRMRWFKVSQLKDGFSYFKEQGVKHVLMAGQISQRNLFDPVVQQDPELKEFFLALQDRKADTIFGAVAGLLKKNGLEVLDSTFLLKTFLASQGTLTKRGPTEKELTDIEFGRTIAKAMGGLDVGQTVVIKDRAIVAIEAMEGTDQCILRGGRIARDGAVVIKTSKPGQDFRFDVPVIGPRTLKNMIKAHCGCLGIEAGKTLMIEEEVCISIANKANICIVSS